MIEVVSDGLENMLWGGDQKKKKKKLVNSIFFFAHYVFRSHLN